LGLRDQTHAEPEGPEEGKNAEGATKLAFEGCLAFFAGAPATIEPVPSPIAVVAPWAAGQNMPLRTSPVVHTDITELSFEVPCERQIGNLGPGRIELARGAPRCFT
jgi:hypothetical protein